MSEQGMAAQVASMTGTDGGGTIENAIGTLSSILEESHSIVSEMYEALQISPAVAESASAKPPTPVSTVDVLLGQIDDVHTKVRYLNERLRITHTEMRRLR